MIQSKQLTLSDMQSIAIAIGTLASTNVIDRGANGTPYGAVSALESDDGNGNGIPFEVIITTDCVGAGASLSATLQVDNDEAFGSPTDVQTSQVIPVADLVAGKNIFPNCHLPQGVNQRYMRILYTVSGAALTAGNVSAFVSGGRQTNQ